MTILALALTLIAHAEPSCPPGQTLHSRPDGWTCSYSGPEGSCSAHSNSQGNASALLPAACAAQGVSMSLGSSSCEQDFDYFCAR